MSRYFRFSRYSLVLIVLIGGGLIFAGLALHTKSADKLNYPIPGVAESVKTPDNQASAAQQARVVENYGRLPLHFIENQGQVNKQVKYYTQGQGQTLFFTKKGMVMALNRPSEKGAKGKQPALNDLHGQRGKIEGKNEKVWPAGIPQEISRPGNRFSQRKKETHQGAVVRLTPVGMRKGVKIEALAPQDYKVNYLLGNNPKRWRTNVPTYKEVVYREAYAGIDLKFYGIGQQLEYDIIVKAGADPNQIKFHYAGIKGLNVTPAGDLAIKLRDGGELLQKKPKVFQEIAGQRVFREGKFKINRNQAELSYGFEVADYNNKYSLIIDPVIEYSIYLRGNDEDFGLRIAVDGAGNAYITGFTKSIDFPTENARYPDLWGSSDAFVTKIKPTGGLAFSTYLGGNGDEGGYGIALDREGTIYVAGKTTSNDFPITNDGLYPALWGPSDAFVSKISNDGSQLLYSTYLGGTSDDTANGIAVDGDRNIYVFGATKSSDFPLKNPLVSNITSGWDSPFITKINSSGTDLIYSTSFYGNWATTITSIAVDSEQNTYVTGMCLGGIFPTTPNVVYPYKTSTSDSGFVTKINPEGSQLCYSTFLRRSYVFSHAITVDHVGAAFLAGSRYNSEGFEEMYVMKLSPDASKVIYSKSLTANSSTNPIRIWGPGGIAVDSDGNAYVTERYEYVTFLKKINVYGTALLYSIFLPDFYGGAIAVDKSGNAYVTGASGNIFTRQYRDVHVAKISDSHHSPVLQPGDIVYRTSPNGEMYGCNPAFPWEVSIGTLLTDFGCGHVGIYIGNGEVIEAGGYTSTPYVVKSSLTKFKNAGKYYLGAKTAETITQVQRDKIVQFAKDQLGQPYAIFKWATSCSSSFEQKGKNFGSAKYYTCVGLAERAYEEAGLNLVPDQNENTAMFAYMPRWCLFIPSFATEIYWPYTQFTSPNLITVEPPAKTCAELSRQAPLSLPVNNEIEIMSEDLKTVDPLPLVQDKATEQVKRLLAAAKLSDSHDGRLAPMIKILKDESELPGIRMLMVEAITHYRTVEVINALKDLLTSQTDENLRLQAARKLAELQAQSSISTLTQVLKDPSSHVRYEAAKALGKIGDRESIEPLIASLGQDRDKFVRVAAVQSLGQFIDDQRVYAALISASQNEEADYVSQKIDSLFKKDPPANEKETPDPKAAPEKSSGQSTAPANLPSSFPSSAPLVDLNTASEKELAALPGIGPLLATKAIRLRQDKGGFASLEDFARALELENRVMNRLKTLVTVKPISTSPPSG